jgi:hypothetical protein
MMFLRFYSKILTKRFSQHQIRYKRYKYVCIISVGPKHRLFKISVLVTVRASTFSRTELFRVPYRTVLLANRITLGKTSSFLAYRYSMVRYDTLKVRFVKKSMRVLYNHGLFWVVAPSMFLFLYKGSNNMDKKNIMIKKHLLRLFGFEGILCLLRWSKRLCGH